MPEPLLIGWINIHKLFCDAEGNPAISLTTLRKKYGPEMFELAVICRMQIGKCKSPRVCGWSSRIQNWWTRKQQKMWVDKKNNIL